MARIVIYPGSFDPPTLGHLDVIRRGSDLFDGLLVGIGHNPSKKYWFNPEEREALLREACAGLPKVRIVSFQGLLIDACRAQGASVILRGLRALSDFDIEFRNGLANRDLANIETLFLLSDPQQIFVSSSLVREIAENHGDISRYVPPGVAAAVRNRVAGS